MCVICEPSRLAAACLFRQQPPPGEALWGGSRWNEQVYSAGSDAPPPPNHHASSYLPHASGERTLVPAASGFSTTEEADWSDNLDAFATASAVVAGVLGAEDMSDDPTPISPLSPFGRMPGRQELAVFREDLLSARHGGNGSYLFFCMSAPPAASGSSGGSPSVNARFGVQDNSLTASSFGSTEKQLLFGTSGDGVHGSGRLSFMYEGDEG